MALYGSERAPGCHEVAGALPRFAPGDVAQIMAGFRQTVIGRLAPP